MFRMSASSSVIDVFDYDSDVMDEDEYIYGSDKRGIDSHQRASANNRGVVIESVDLQRSTNSSESPLWNRRQDITDRRDSQVTFNERNTRLREKADVGFNGSDQGNARLPEFIRVGSDSRVRVCPRDVSQNLDDVVSSMTADHERDVIVVPTSNIRNNARHVQSLARRVDASTFPSDRPSERGCQEIIEVEPSVGQSGTRRSTSPLYGVRSANTSNDALFAKSSADNHVARDTDSYRDPIRQDSRVSTSARLTRDNDIAMDIDSSFQSRTLSVNSSRSSEKQHENESESLHKNKAKPPNKIWLTCVPAGMESSIIMNPGPMTGKKYRKRLKRALAERVEDMEYYLGAQSNPRYSDCAIDDVNCEMLAYVNPSDQSQPSNKRTKCGDDDPVTTSKSSQVSSSSRRQSSNNRNSGSFLNNKSKSCTKPDSNLEPNDGESLRLRNIRLQAILKLERLDQQLDQLKKKNELLLKRNGCSSTSRSDFLTENERLQEKITMQANDLREILSAIDVLQNAIDPTKASVTKSLPTDYHFYDAGDHWCKFCSDVFDSITDLLTHVHEQHICFIQGLSPVDRPWAVQPRETAGKRQLKYVPFKGGEFLYPCQAFFCDICKTYMGDESTAKVHLESLDHNTTYKKYCEDHPNYVKDVDTNVATRKELKRKTDELKFKAALSLETSNSVTAPITKRSVKNTLPTPSGPLRSTSQPAAESQASSSAISSSTSKVESEMVVQSTATSKPEDSVHLEKSSQSNDKSEDILLLSNGDAIDELSIDDDMLYKGEYGNMCQLELMDSWCVEDVEVEEDVEYGTGSAQLDSSK